MATIEVFTGPMFAGKSTRLLNRVATFTDAGAEVLLVKHATDTRYAEKAIVTHDGKRLDAHVANSGNDLTVLLEKHPAKIVAVDEVQFFDHSFVSWARKARAEGVTVVCAGLDRDSQGQPFGPMPYLLAFADAVHKLAGECPCGLLAVQTRRKADAPQGFIGGSERYESVCWPCFYKWGSF